TDLVYGKHDTRVYKQLSERQPQGKSGEGRRSGLPSGKGQGQPKKRGKGDSKAALPMDADDDFDF
ncbi:MAG: hypothetical protein LBE49_00990, partial [Deltaproteobacteria bacterium]|nr:hypothetical protein [Deltaproteobacteria bacterium]